MKPLLALLAFSTAALAQPAITAILDGAALTQDVAQGSVFIIKGSGLSAAGFSSAPPPTYPAALNSVRITWTAVAGSAVVNSLMVYTYNLNGVNQLAAVLPSTTAVGAYDVRVENGAATSTPYRAQVVARKPGIVAANGDGSGPAQATINGQLVLVRTSNLGAIGAYTTRSVHPGERVDLWGTGLGPDVASDTGGSAGDQTAAAEIRVLVNGTEVTPLYAGRAQTMPGLDTVAFNLPANTVLSCQVTIQVRAGQVFSNPVTIATATGDACPASAVRINEIETNLGTPGDWVELFNPGPNAVNIGGFGFKDNDDTHNYLIPAGTTIAAGGYYVLEEAAFNFGLGAAGENARLFDAGGTLIDFFTWPAHAITTYGRCVNGTGAFITTNNSTKGAANDCFSPVKINEVESNLGLPGDWVELFNPGPAPANVSGFVFKDNDDSRTFQIPAGTTIPVGGYYVLDEAAFNFGLGAADSARLYNLSGAIVDTYSWTAHATVTYGRCPNGTGEFKDTTTATKGIANDCGTATSLVKINEVESNGGTPGDWVELYNPGPGVASVGGFVFKDNDDTRTFQIPAGTTIAAGGYYMLEEAAFGFGLGAADSARLYNGTTLVDTYSWTEHAAITYGRCPNGTGSFTANLTSTKNAANDCSVAAAAVVKINEVESDGGTPGDWVELFNAGPGVANVGGLLFKDNDDTRTFAIAAGTTIPEGGYLVLEEATFGFGLGGADSARLFNGTTLVDTYTWTAHATATTYGRCPNGSGAFITTAAVTKGAANNCGTAPAGIVLNEVESNGGTPDDWFELLNTGSAAVDISGWKMIDNDDTHAFYVFPAGSILAPGAYKVVESADFGFGLGAPDSVRIFDASGTLYTTYTWATHAANTTYGRCPNATGELTTTNSSTKGAANDCANPIKINEIESDGGTPGDWVELYNPTSVAVSIAGLILRDNDDTHTYTIPAGTSIPAASYFVVEESALGFGLGGADSVRLFEGATVLDTYVWTAHATATTYGRCPDGTGNFATTTASTKGAVNTCPGEVSFAAWPGGATIQTAGAGGAVFAGNMSGLVYEASGTAAPGVMWSSRNGPGTIFRLIYNGTVWVPDTANNWTTGKLLRYPDGTGDPDSEGITFAGTTAATGGIYVATERNNAANGVSRNAILRFDPTAAGATLTATNDWNITADLPAVGPNAGIEAIAWIPDTFLTSKNFFDESKNRAYNPADYPNHGAGLFFVGMEFNGTIYGYALNHTNNTFTKVATIASGFPAVMELTFDRDTNDFWAVCDDGCQGRSAVLRIDGTGKFVPTLRYDRPTGMPNLNNEGFAIAPAALCTGGFKPVYWMDDAETGGHSLRSGTLSCAVLQ